jgi:hypothetical protein
MLSSRLTMVSNRDYFARISYGLIVGLLWSSSGATRVLLVEILWPAVEIAADQ